MNTKELLAQYEAELDAHLGELEERLADALDEVRKERRLNKAVYAAPMIVRAVPRILGELPFGKVMTKYGAVRAGQRALMEEARRG